MFVNYIWSYFESNGRALRFSLNKLIINDIIGRLLFHLDKFKGVIITWVLSLFKKNEPLLKAFANEFDLTTFNKYVTKINISKRSYLVIGCVALKTILCMASQLV